MHLDLVRLNIHHNHSTLGVLYIDDVFQCYTLENPFRFAKMDGVSAIQDGTYVIKKREVLSGMTKSYRKRYPWFDYHLELQDVPEFNYIYLHVGNQQTNTDGCILVGETQDFTNQFVGRSVPAFENLYKRISEALDAGEDVTITLQYLSV